MREGELQNHSAVYETALSTIWSDLCSGKAEGRRSPDEITLFKSVGTALEDLAAAALAYRSAL